MCTDSLLITHSGKGWVKRLSSSFPAPLLTAVLSWRYKNTFILCWLSVLERCCCWVVRALATDAEDLGFETRLSMGFFNNFLCSPSSKWVLDSLQSWGRWRGWERGVAPHSSYTIASTSRLFNSHFPAAITGYGTSLTLTWVSLFAGDTNLDELFDELEDLSEESDNEHDNISILSITKPRLHPYFPMTQSQDCLAPRPESDNESTHSHHVSYVMEIRGMFYFIWHHEASGITGYQDAETVGWHKWVTIR